MDSVPPSLPLTDVGPSDRLGHIDHHPEPFGGYSRFKLKAKGNAAKNYDFVEARGLRRTNNIPESTGHLIKSSLGGGVVAIHEAYKNCGLWTALILNIFLGFAVTYYMYVLCKSAQKMYGRVHVHSLTYPDLAEASLAAGPWKKMRKYSRAFRHMVDSVIVIELFGACCVYQVVVARSLKQLVDGTDNLLEEVAPPIRVYIMGLFVPCMLLCMVTSLKYIAPFSIVAALFILTVVISTVYYGLKSSTQSSTDMPIMKTVSGMVQFIGVGLFSVEGIVAALAIENNMTNPKKVALVIVGGMSIVTSAVMVVGFFGYWGFGERCMSPITLNFLWNHFPIMLKVSMAMMIYITFALNFWIPFELVWFYIQDHHNRDRFWLWERVYRAIFVLIITLIAFTFPNITNFIGIIGSLCASNMVFIFPAIIQLSLDWEDPGLGPLRWRLWRAVLIILLGATLCVVGTYMHTREMIMEVFVRNKMAFPQ